MKEEVSTAALLAIPEGHMGNVTHCHGLSKQEAKISPFMLIAILGDGSHVFLQHLDVYQVQTVTPRKILEMSQKHFQSSEK